MTADQRATVLLYLNSSVAQCWAVGFAIAYVLMQWRLNYIRESIRNIAIHIAELGCELNLNREEISKLQSGVYQVLDKDRCAELFHQWAAVNTPESEEKGLDHYDDEDIRAWAKSISVLSSDSMTQHKLLDIHKDTTHLLRMAFLWITIVVIYFILCLSLSYWIAQSWFLVMFFFCVAIVLSATTGVAIWRIVKKELLPVDLHVNLTEAIAQTQIMIDSVFPSEKETTEPDSA